MIQREQSAYEVEGNLDGRVIDMSIDASAMALVMRTLTRLYSDPEQAVIREYTTNARDSHIEAGNTDPIKVYTPTPLSPFFRVVDQGVGLNPDDIFAIYSRYGASTKRHTNEQTGMLGYGCKSALAYASQFTLTGVKDGVRTQVSISRDSAGAGQMTVVDTATTDAPNGVEIMVPVRTPNEFDRKAKRLFSFWKPGTVLLNDAEPKHHGGLQLTDDLFVIEGDGYNRAQDTIVMGNVPYPVKNRLSERLSYQRAVLAYVPIGAVDFTPSREELEYTDATNETIERIQREFADASGVVIQRDVDKAKSYPDALTAVATWREVLPDAWKNTYSYRGTAMPSEWKQDDMFIVPFRSHIESENVLAYNGHPVGSWPATTWVYGYELEKKWTAPKGRKLRKYAAEHGIEGRHFAVVKDKPVSVWIDPATCISWEEVAKVKLDRVPSASTGRVPGSYPGYVNGDWQRSILATDIDTTKPLFYVEGGRWAGDEYLDLLRTKFPKGFTMVRLTANRVEKFKRDFPQAKTAHAGIQALYDAWRKRLTPVQQRALAIYDVGTYRYYDDPSSTWKTLRKLDPSRIKDPEIREAIEATKVDLKSVRASRKLYSDAGFSLARTEDWKNPLSKYPLFSDHHMEHSYIYLNAAYAAAKRGA